MHIRNITVLATLLVQLTLCAKMKNAFSFEEADPEEPFCEYSGRKLEGWGTAFLQLPYAKGWGHSCTEDFEKSLKGFCALRGTAIQAYQKDFYRDIDICVILFWIQDHSCILEALRCNAQGATLPAQCQGSFTAHFCSTSVANATRSD